LLASKRWERKGCLDLSGRKGLLNRHLDEKTPKPLVYSLPTAFREPQGIVADFSATCSDCAAKLGSH